MWNVVDLVVDINILILLLLFQNYYPAQRRPDPGHPGRFIFDYATCPGGGRIELIARMLAVRDVYAHSDIKNPLEERRVAAIAADAAPLDPAYIARATAIFAQPEADRKFNVPETKNYDDLAYRQPGNENVQEGGKRVPIATQTIRNIQHARKTQKTRKTIKKRKTKDV